MLQLIKKLLPIFLLLLVLGLTVSLVRTIWRSHQVLESVELEKIKTEKLENSVLELEKTVQEATSSFELERRSRQELNLQKEGEQEIPVKKRL